MPLFDDRQQSDPIEQLLYACFHSRKALDRIDRAIWTQFPQPRTPTPRERHQIRTRQETPESLRLQDNLFWTPYGRSLADTQHSLRTQLANIAKQYVSLGIEERRTRSIEAWAAVIIPLAEALLNDATLSLDRRQKEVFPQVVEHHLQVIEGSATEIAPQMDEVRHLTDDVPGIGTLPERSTFRPARKVRPPRAANG
jgi:hypothetical protein